MTDLPFERRELLKIAGISVAGVTGVGQVVADSNETDNSSNPTKIENWHDLDAVREDLEGDYVLAVDLDSDTNGYDEHVGDPEAGFEPIGDFDVNDDVEFTGTFDGNDNEIADLVIDRPDEDNVGLFGGNEGRIENVTLTNAAVTGDSSVGGLVGWNLSGQIASSVAEGDVTGMTSFVGGLVGQNDGEIASAAAEGDVRGEGFVGGLAGSSSGEIELSSSSVDVTGEGLVGGLVGINSPGGEIASSAAKGDVTGDFDVGGLVGENDIGSEIASSFATGVVDGETTVGGVVGEDQRTVTNTYWDVEATGQQDGIGDGQGDTTGLDTDEMQGEAAAENMEALDFEETWQTVTDPDDYPILQWRESEENIGDDPEDPNDGDTDDGENGDSDDSDDGETDGTDDSETDGTDDDDGFGPGFGVGSALGGLGGAAYLLKKRVTAKETDSE